MYFFNFILTKRKYLEGHYKFYRMDDYLFCTSGWLGEYYESLDHRTLNKKKGKGLTLYCRFGYVRFISVGEKASNHNQTK